MSHDMSQMRGLHHGFLSSAMKFSGRAALEVSGAIFSYGELQHISRSVSASLPRHGPEDWNAVGILASHEVSAYAGILGALMAGATAVPLNPSFPAGRTIEMIRIAGVSALVVGLDHFESVAAVLDQLPASMLVLTPAACLAAYSQRWPQHRVVSFGGEADIPADAESLPVAQRYAYVFFTSGSTGVPKAVGVLHSNVCRFVDMSVERYSDLGICETDRFSQFYDITFDSSMFDLFVAWAFGACVCCPSTADIVNLNRYIEQRELTVIDLVPSLGHAMNRSNGWRAGRFQKLRLCRFGGEALSAELADKLADAAPGAAIDNVYGPTECTVDATYYRWQRDRSPAECAHGIVPIGMAGPQVELRVVDADLRDVSKGQEGELLIAGPQVTPGYWKDSKRTELSFVRLADSERIYYRTGDLVRSVPVDEPIPYLGRLDQQIKIAGVRIELGEIESALRSASGAATAVALGWPLTQSGASGIVGFVAKTGADGAEIRRTLKQLLPAVMVPRVVYVIEAFPLNVNGKVDRKVLLEQLKANTSSWQITSI